MIKFLGNNLGYVMIAVAWLMICLSFIEDCFRQGYYKEAFVALSLLFAIQLSFAMVRFV